MLRNPIWRWWNLFQGKWLGIEPRNSLCYEILIVVIPRTASIVLLNVCAMSPHWRWNDGESGFENAKITFKLRWSKNKNSALVPSHGKQQCETSQNVPWSKDTFPQRPRGILRLVVGHESEISNSFREKPFSKNTMKYFAGSFSSSRLSRTRSGRWSSSDECHNVSDKDFYFAREATKTPKNLPTKLNRPR